MKNFLYIAFCLCCVVIFFSSCDEKSQLIESLKPDVESKLTEAGATDFKVEDIILVNEGGNKYKGVVKIKESDGTHDYDIEVVSDGDSYTWEMQNTPVQRQALKKLQKGLEQAQKEIGKSLDELQSDYDNSINEVQDEYDYSSSEYDNY